MSIFSGDERLDQLGVYEVAVELIQLIQPEVITLEVECRFRWIVRVSSEVAEILHEDEGFILLHKQ